MVLGPRLSTHKKKTKRDNAIFGTQKINLHNISCIFSILDAIKL